MRTGADDLPGTSRLREQVSREILLTSRLGGNVRPRALPPPMWTTTDCHRFLMPAERVAFGGSSFPEQM